MFSEYFVVSFETDPSTSHCHFWNALDWTQSESQRAPRRAAQRCLAPISYLGRVWKRNKIPSDRSSFKDTLLGTVPYHIPYQCIFEDECPFPKMGYVSSVQSKVLYFFLKYNLWWNFRYQGIIKQCQFVTIFSVNFDLQSSAGFGGGNIFRIYWAWK